MRRIEERFGKLAGEGRKAFMPFVTACDPEPAATVEIVAALEDAGADMVELGAAYSDPIADGPVIQDAYARVLGAGRGMDDYLATIETIRDRSDLPVAAMVSYSIIFRRGVEKFVRQAGGAGVDAVIVPDLPPAEAGELREAGEAENVGTVFLAAPTTSPERLAEIAEASKPFIYYVSLVGTTGARDELPPELAEGVAGLKGLTKRPVVVGFGVSNARVAAQVAGIADGVIVGSAIVDLIARHKDEPAAKIAAEVLKFAGELAEAVHSV